jgi:RHS repeat-associated protein
MRLGNGRFESTQFNSRLQPTQIALGTSATNTSLLKLNYDYGTTDNNGNVKSQTITVPGMSHPHIQTYTYDELNRLKSAVETANNQTTWRQTYLFDRYGNRNFDTTNTTTPNTQQQSETVFNPTVDTATNRFTSGQGYVYDANGNVIQDAQVRSFAYDAENRQTSFGTNNSNNNSGLYVYDGNGQRVKKTVIATNEMTTFVYDAMGKMVAEYTNITQQGTSEIRYLVTDTLGSPRIITNQSGQIKERHDYMPFGEEITTNSEDKVRQKFSQKERDAEINLDYFLARYYSNITGRFTSVDPIALTQERLYDPQTLNLYVYTRNNPLKYVDLNGEDIKVTAKDGKELFILDDGKKEVTTMTAMDLYKKGIQWFEPEADNYMPLKSTANGIEKFSELKHFTWDQIANFAEQDRAMSSYRQGGSGDWKSSKEGADGYFLVTVNGMPYWADAIGQIPFAVDYFTDRLESNGDPEKAAKETLQKGQEYAEGRILGGKRDTSNTYDNYFVLRGAIWASHRWQVSEPGKIYGYYIERKDTYHPPIRLSDPISKKNAQFYGLKK